MKKKKTYIFLSVAVVILIASCTLSIVFQNSRERIEASINHVFSESIQQDYEKRLRQVNYHDSGKLRYKVKNFTSSPTSDRKIKEYTVKTRTGETTYTFKNSVDEQHAKMLMNQYLLAELNPIKPEELKAVFQNELSKRSIHGAVGIAYFDQNQTLFSLNDSLVPSSAYQTPRYTLDINGRIRIQAWVDYNWQTLLRHADDTAFWLITQCMLFGMLLFFGFRRKGQNKPAPALVIDMEKQELRIGDRLCNIRKLDLALLNIFVERTGECVSREEIKQIFWPTDDNANEKIDAHIKTIRKVLKEAPEYSLVTVRGKGYYLSHK